MEKLARQVQAEDEAHQSSGLTKEAFGVLRILEAHQNDGVGLEGVARQIDQLYVADATAPPGWTRKPELRKELRQQVRRIVHPLGLNNWKEIPAEVDTYAGKHYVKI
jgi:type I restriction enzyme R subunit